MLANLQTPFWGLENQAPRWPPSPRRRPSPHKKGAIRPSQLINQLWYHALAGSADSDFFDQCIEIDLIEFSLFLQFREAHVGQCGDVLLAFDIMFKRNTFHNRHILIKLFLVLYYYFSNFHEEFFKCNRKIIYRPEAAPKATQSHLRKPPAQPPKSHESPAPRVSTAQKPHLPPKQKTPAPANATKREFLL